MKVSHLVSCLLASLLAAGSAGGVAAFTPQQDSGGVRMTGPELAVWNDPDFKRRFAESYIAETEVEPRLTKSESEDLGDFRELMAADKVDEAAALLEDLREEGCSAVIDFMLGNIYFQREEFDKAAANYELAVQKYPRFLRAWRNLGKLYARGAEYEKAVPALTRVVELGGSDALTYGLLGISFVNVGNYLSAESAFRMANLLDPRSIDWKMGMAESFFKQQRFAEAAALAGALIEEQPDNPRFWLIQANAYVGMEQPLKAAENFEMVNRLGAATPATLNMLGDIYATRQLYDMSVASYMQAMELDTEGKVDRPLQAAKFLAGSGALEATRTLVDGIEAARGSKLSDEDRKEILKIRARIAVKDGGGDEEARVLEQIVALDPLDGEALLLLGRHSRLSGDPERAIFYFERAAGLDGFEADALVGQAQVLVGQNKYAEALPLLRQAQSIKFQEHVQPYLDQVERIAQSRS